MERKPPMMKCGHAANAVNGKGEHACAICVGITPDAYIVDENPPSLEGRIAKCSCGATQPSDPDLAFFEHGRYAKGDPGGPAIKRVYDYDTFYCGCRGWD